MTLVETSVSDDPYTGTEDNGIVSPGTHLRLLDQDEFTRDTTLPWQFAAGVEGFILKKAEPELDEFGNTFYFYRVVMTDGNKISLNFCEPRERVTDVAVVETPALFTGTRGFNKGTQSLFASLGYPSLMVGHIGEERDNWFKELASFMLHPEKTLQELNSISCARFAQNMLLVHQAFNEYLPSGIRPIDETRLLLFGNSRGADAVLGALAQMEGLSSPVKVPFALAVAACYKNSIGKENICKLSLQLPIEFSNIALLGISNLIDWGRMSIDTLNLSPKALIYELAHIPTLVNGDAGEFTPYIQPDQNLLMLCYGNDVAGQIEDWREDFKDHPNTLVKRAPGGHLSLGVDVRTRRYVMDKFSGIADQFQQGVYPDDLDLPFLHAPK